jgi:hypothetical protein
MNNIQKMDRAIDWLRLYGENVKDEKHKEYALYLRRLVVFRYDNLVYPCRCSECAEFLQGDPVSLPPDFPEIAEKIVDNAFN